MSTESTTLSDAARFLEVLSADYAYKADYLAADAQTRAKYEAIARKAATLAAAIRAHRCSEP